MDDGEENDTIPLLLLSLRIFEHIQSHYNDYDELMAQDVLELLESIVQCLVLLIDLDNEDDIFTVVKDLILAIERDLQLRKVRVKGRPPILIEENQLRYLVDNGFKAKDIATIHGCSRRTIERRMNKFNVRH